MTRIQTLVSGFVALLALLIGLVGVPAALLALGGNPLPDHVPSLNEAWTAVSTPDASGTLFIAVMTIIGWLGWASFAVSTVIETAGALSQWQPPQLPGPMRLTQGSSAVLVGAVIAAIAIIGTGTAPAMASPAAPAGAGSVSASVSTSAPAASQSASTHQGDAAAADADVEAQESVMVERGDTLWQIAEDELGDGARYDELVDATTGQTQPDGEQLTDPDLIYPGWQIAVPATADKEPSPQQQSASRSDADEQASADAAADPQTGTEESDPLSEASSAPSPAAVGDASAGDAGRSKAPEASSGPPSTTAPKASPATPKTTSESTVEGRSDSSTSSAVVVTTAGLGALAAAGILTLLRRRRSRQSQHRTPGRRVALPTGDAAIAEAQMRAAADLVAAHDLDRVLRTLAADATSQGTTLPALRAARLCADSLELYLVDEDAVLPQPFTQDDPGVWILRRVDMTDEVLLSEDEAAEQMAPYPALVTVGYDDSRAHVLLNLEELRSLSLVGDDELSTAVLTAMTVELLGSEWTDDTRITLVGVLPDLIDAIGSDRATYVDTLDEILTALEYTSTVVRGAMADAGVYNARDARTAGVVDESWTPHLILLTGQVDPGDRARLAAIIEDIPRVAVASIVTGSDPVGEWTLDLTGDPDQPASASAVLNPIALQVTPQLLPRATYEATLAAFHTADEPDVDGPSWTEGITETAIDLSTIPAPSTVLDEDLDPYDLAESTESASASNEDALEDVEAPIIHELQETAPEVEDQPGPTHAPRHAPIPAPIESVEDDAPAGHAGGDTDGEDLEVQSEEGREVEQVAAESFTLSRDRPQIRLLGPVHIAGAQGKKPTAPRRMTELVAYLALHGGQGPQPFTEAIFPGDRSKKAGQKRNQYMVSARNWLKSGPHGQPYVSMVDEGGYRLDEDTAVDWWLFQELVTEGLSHTPTRYLQAALDLVSGQPLSGTDEDRYSWADTDRQEMIAAVADVAHELARRALDIGDVRTATLAAAKGLEVEPVSEVLWRDAIAAAYATGRPGRAQHVIADCRRQLDEYGDLEDETIDLINDVLTRIRATDTTTAPEPVHN